MERNRCRTDGRTKRQTDRQADIVAERKFLDRRAYRVAYKRAGRLQHEAGLLTGRHNADVMALRHTDRHARRTTVKWIDGHTCVQTNGQSKRGRHTRGSRAILQIN